jgi:hypothetical protein
MASKKTTVNLSDIIAVDDGSSNAKTAYWVKGQNGERAIKTGIYPTRVYSRPTTAHAAVGPVQAGLYVINDKTMMIDATETSDQGRIDTRSSEFQTSEAAIAITQYAMEQEGFGGREVALAVGVPLEAYFSGSGKGVNTVLTDKKKNGLRKAVILNECSDSHSIMPNTVDEDRLVSPKTVVVLPEALGAFFSMTIDHQTGAFNKNEGDTLIVDIGSYTLDISVVSSAGAARTEFCRTFPNSGFMYILDKIRDKLLQANTGMNEFTNSKLEEALRTGKIKWLNHSLDVTPFVKAVLDEQIPPIVSKIESLLGDSGLQSLSNAVIVGAGAESINPYFKKLAGSVDIPENPQFANAIGYLLMLTYHNGMTVIDDIAGE